MTVPLLKYHHGEKSRPGGTTKQSFSLTMDCFTFLKFFRNKSFAMTIKTIKTSYLLI